MNLAGTELGVHDRRVDYECVAPFYDALGWLYTGGQIARLELSQARAFAPGSRVLYAGAGTGRELESALAAGARPTALDSSPGMLARARRRLGGAAAGVRFCCEDVLAHQPEQAYDSVVANFFLNVFSQSRMPRVLERLIGWLRPGGTLLIGDFAPPSARVLERTLQRAYYLPPLSLFWLTTGNAWHPLYDYRELAARRGLGLVREERVRVFRWGPRWLSSMTFQKQGHARA